MALSDFVSVTLTSTGPAVTLPGFGTPLISAIDAPAGFTNRVRVYNKPADLVADGFSATGSTYLLASAVCSQSPRPPTFKVGRCANIPTMQWLLTPVATANATYQIIIDGLTAQYVAGASPTVTAISAGLKAAVDGLGLAVTTAVPVNWAPSTGYTAGNQVVTAAGSIFQCTGDGTSLGSGTGPVGTLNQTGISDGTVGWKCIALGAVGAATKLTIISTTPATWHTVYVQDSTGNKANGTSLLGVLQNTGDAGVTADLNAIVAEDANWYALLGAPNSAAIITARAVWAESNKKLNGCSTQDSAIVNTVLSGATDIAATLQNSAYFYTHLWYSPSNGDFLAAGISGIKLTANPGSEIWGLTTVSAMSATLLTPTQRANALAKNCNVYEPVAGVNITETGKVASGEWIDVVRFKDWQIADMQTALFTQLLNAAQTNSKVPYTDDGIQAIKGTIQASLKRGVQAGGLARNPAPIVTVPLVANVTTTDKQNRALTTVTFRAYLAGAIQAVAPIIGTLTY